MLHVFERALAASYFGHLISVDGIAGDDACAGGGGMRVFLVVVVVAYYALMMENQGGW